METINDILFWICLFVLLWNGYFLLVNRGIPNIRTAPAIRKEIIARLKADAAARGKNPYVVIDLGSGNGKFTREIAHAIPHAHVIGYEISLPAYKWSLMLKKLRGLNNLEYKREDFFAANLSNADAVVMYLTIDFMEKIGKKLHAELKPGTLVTSNRFKLGDGWIPEESIDISTAYPHQKTLNIYRMS